MSSLTIQASPIVIDFNDLGKTKKIDFPLNQDYTKLVWERRPRISANFFTGEERRIFRISIENIDLIQITQDTQNSIKDRLKLRRDWNDLVWITISHDVNDASFLSSSDHEIALTWKLSDIKTKTLEHPYLIFLNMECIQDFDFNGQFVDDIYLKFNIEFDKNLKNKELEIKEVTLPLNFIPLKVKLQLSTEIDPSSFYSGGVNFKGNDLEKIGGCTIENNPMTGIRFVETFEGNLSIVCPEYPQALRFELDGHQLTDTIHSLEVKPFTKTSYPLVLDFKKIPLFWQEKELKYNLIATNVQTKLVIEREQSIRINASPEPPKIIFPKTEYHVNFDSLNDHWQVIKHEKLHNEFFDVHPELIDVKIRLEDTQLLAELNLNNPSQFLHFQLDQGASHQSYVADYNMHSREMPFSILLNTDLLRTYQGEYGRIELKILLSYRLGLNIHPQKLLFPLELILTKAAPRLVPQFYSNLSKIDLAQSYSDRFSLGTISLNNRPIAAFAEHYITIIGLRSEDVYLSAALSFINYKEKEHEVEIAPNAVKSIEVFLDASLLKYNTERTLNFDVYDSRQNQIVYSGKLSFLPALRLLPIEINNLKPIYHDFNEEVLDYYVICELSLISRVPEVEMFKRVQIVDIFIGELETEHGIIFKPSKEAQIFTLAFQDKVNDSLYNLNINSNAPASVMVNFNHQAILDFVGEQAEVPFWLNVEAEEADGLHVEVYRIESKVIFKKRAAKLELDIQLETDTDGEILQDMGKAVKLGVMRVKNDTPVNYSELLETFLEAKISSEENISVTPNIVSFQEPPYDYPKRALVLENQSCQLKLARKDGELEIPIVIYLNTLEGHDKDIEYRLEIIDLISGNKFEDTFVVKGRVSFNLFLDTKPETQKDFTISIKGGFFIMGDSLGDEEFDDEVPHSRSVKDFKLAPFPVTFAEYDHFCFSVGKKLPEDQGWGRDKYPLINVNWFEAIEYCNWRSEEESLQKVYSFETNRIEVDWKANGYRLPTEAEWEYAAREGGRNVRFGNGTLKVDPRVVNFDGSLAFKKDYSFEGPKRNKTVPVGSLPNANALELYDMSGNVWEWCWDWYGQYGEESIPPNDLKAGTSRVIRGGSWRFPAACIRNAYRGDCSPDVRSCSIGFRLAKTVF